MRTHLSALLLQRLRQAEASSMMLTVSCVVDADVSQVHPALNQHGNVCRSGNGAMCKPYIRGFYKSQ